MIDSLRRDRLGSYGHDRPTSPRIDALARSGVLYTAAVSTAPWTTPSVASILTSHLPSTLGIRPRAALDDDVELLSELLAAKGYATAAVISHSYLDSDRNFDQGFDVFDEANVKPADGISSRGVSDAAIAWLREAQRPFFLFVHYFDPHFPYLEHEGFAMPPREGAAPYRGPVRSGLRWQELRRLAEAGALSAEDAVELLRLYDSEIAFTDAEIGRVLDALEEEGSAGNTLLLLTADHGEEFLDHDGVGHTRSLYEELVAVPLVVRFPEAVASRRSGAAQPRVDSAPASLLDVLPTVLDVAGIASEGPVAGTSLLAARPPERPLYSETSRGASLRAVRGGGFKLIEDRATGETALFDLDADAGETRDLSADPEHAATLESLRGALGRWPAAGGAGPGAPVEISPEESERLRALGYTGDGPDRPQRGDTEAAGDTGASLLRPNLVLVVLDDLGREGLASYGGGAWQTPQLDRLAAEGMVFDHFYSTPVCGDSRAQLATGQYTFRTGLARHPLDPALAPPAREGSGPDTRLARLLRQRGYATIFAGKKHVPRPLRGAARRDDLVAVVEAEGWERHAWALANLEGEKQPKYWGGTVLRDGVLERLPAERYTPDWLISFVEERIAEAAAGARPFFLQYSLLLAHGPHEPTPLSRGRGGVTAFPDLVHYLDRQLGRLVGALEAAGVAGETLVLVLSDNGSAAGVRAALLGREAGGGKRHLSDAGTRVPALAWWPGVVEPGRNPNLVDLTDVLPTFVALADGVLAGRPAQLPSGLDGLSFARQLVGEGEGGRTWQFGQFDEQGTHYYVRDLRWKLYHDGRLYDVASDPAEDRPLLPGEEPAEASRARAFLRERLGELNPRFLEPAPARG